jgi:hypothetical protein
VVEVKQVLTKRALIAVVAVAASVGLAIPAMGGGRPLSAELSADQEVPPVASEATGTAQFTLNQGQGEVCVDIESSGYVNGDDDVIAGHIHIGAAGVPGGIVVNLEVASADHSICVDGVDKDLIKDIKQNPGNYYINLHTTFAPGGEIRGQLSK